MWNQTLTKLKLFFKNMPNQWIKLQICWFVLTDGKHERVGQFIHNRLYKKYKDVDIFQIYDKTLLNEIKRFKNEHT